MEWPAAPVPAVIMIGFERCARRLPDGGSLTLWEESPRQVARRGSFQEMIGNLGEQVVEGSGSDALAMIVPTDQGFESDE
jgi:hypothetical protein